MKNKKMYFAVKGLIFKEGKLLILKRSKTEDCFEDMWDIPGGRINFGEEPEEALKREVKEETNLEIEVKNPVRVWTFFKDRGNTQVIGITMLCEYKKGEVILSKEHEDFKWIIPEEIKNYKVHGGIKKEVEEALSIISR